MAVMLRRYQQQAVAKVRNAVKKGVPSTVVVNPTGTGKTHLGVYWLREDYHPKDHRVLWMAHTEELVRQAMKAARQQDPRLDGRFGNMSRPGMGLVQGRNAAQHARWVFGTVQTLSKQPRLRSYLEHGLPKVIVVDECHHATATTYQDAILKTLAWFSKLNDFDAAWDKAHDPDDNGTVLELFEKLKVPFTVLGLTATAKRTDGRALGEVFKSISYQYTLPAAITDGYLKPYVCETVLTTIPFDRVKVNPTTGEFVMTDLVAVLEEDGVGNWPELVFESWLEKTGGEMQTIAFFPSIPMAEYFGKMAREKGYATAHIGSEFCVDADGTYYFSKKKASYRAARQRIIEEFKPGGTRILTGYNALLEGFDSVTDCILWARPTKSDIVLTQGIGRGLRTYPGVARQFRMENGAWLVQWDTLQSGVHVLNEFDLDLDIEEREDKYWTTFPETPPFHTTCTVLDFVDTEANLLVAGNLFGNAFKPASPDVLEDEEAETIPLDEDADGETFEEIGRKVALETDGLSDGQGRVFKPKSLFRGAAENWHDAGDQIMAAQMGYIEPEAGSEWGQSTVLMIYPPSEDIADEFAQKIKLWRRRRRNIDMTAPDADRKLTVADERVQQFKAMHDLFNSFSIWEVACPVLDKGEVNDRGYPERQEQWWSDNVTARVRALVSNGVDAFEQAVVIGSEFPPLEGFASKGGTGRSKRLDTNRGLYRTLTTGFVAKQAAKYGVPIPSVQAVKSFTQGEASKWRATVLAHCHVKAALTQAKALRTVPWMDE